MVVLSLIFDDDCKTSMMHEYATTCPLPTSKTIHHPSPNDLSRTNKADNGSFIRFFLFIRAMEYIMKMKNRAMAIMVLATALVLAGTATAGKVIDEQFGPDGSTVELVKAKVRNGVLTLAVRYVHPWELTTAKEREDYEISGQNRMYQIKNREIPIKFKVGSVFYVADGKKYHVLKDKAGNWLAAPVAGDYIAGPADRDVLQKMKKKNQIPALFLTDDHPVQVLWFKFPAPPEGITNIEFQIPEVTPFDVEIKR